MKQSEQLLREGACHLECMTRGVLHERHMEKYIATEHWESLMTGWDDDWFCYSSSKHSMILEWLGLGVTTFIRSSGAENTGERVPCGQGKEEVGWG
uniref:Uncharacterized protein n=1 Tax=Sphenodon punctatus TaxID=8508 RepID=A0A8D0HIZ2_SPHPU